ncbi:hypothetical protein DACRYDRAFT_120025 [Dacryopinax primogenitus]|uniref:Ataxin-10 homolog n=1 Tax=Dacryopinax primogenitus (strain DJM 731) TaxID=1858805 RepID=M5FYK6_DACPD|nr:uncharacterized protein DACRYDRAFT_120025 [Dacryopinax primogenitus]EJT96597.1 hypothetical protein DACRYDRAFT_120025 [Dacryopinax primogenitus]
MSIGFPYGLDTGDANSSKEDRISTGTALLSYSRHLASSAEARSALAPQDDFWVGLNRNWELLASVFQPGEDEGYADYLLGLTRLTRNAVAGVPENQNKAFIAEPSIRIIVQALTAGVWLNDEGYYPHVQSLAQLLSNMITSNDTLAQRIWEAYAALPGELSPILRLLYSTDVNTIISTFVLVLNLTVESVHRTTILPETRVVVPLLDWIDRVFESEEEGDEAKVFQLGYSVFSNVFQLDLFDHLFVSLSIPSHLLPPAQLTLLKLYDSYLHAPSRSTVPISSVYSLIPSLLSLSEHIRHLQDHQQPEVNLGQGIVLVLDIVNQSVLREDADSKSKRDLRAVLERSRGEDGVGVPESLIELLRYLTSHTPAIHPLDEGPESTEPDALSYVNRSIVRLVSTLAHGSPEVQDRVGQVGGVELILSLTTGDRRNPYLREHALFAVRNLLAGNVENQKRVEGIELQGTEDASGGITGLKLRARE